MAAIRCKSFGCTVCLAEWPITTATPVTAQSANVAETKIVAGAAYLAESAAVANYVRSPHSAMKITIKELQTDNQKLWRFGFNPS